MRVGDVPANCSCSNVCTNGCGYATTPTVATVVATCPEFILNPISDGGDTKTYCYDFVAINTTVSFGMIITSNCGAGNVSGFTWTLQTGACGANVATGGLGGLSASGLIIGTRYVLCYTYTIPTTCHHSSLYPYFVGASPLPIELEGLRGYNEGDNNVISWVTVSESKNDFFILERSVDGLNFSEIAQLKGAGNSEQTLQYTLYDTDYRSTVNYYRLVQVDYDGTRTTSKMISVDNSLSAKKIEKIVNIMGQEVDQSYKGLVIEMYTDGTQRKVYR